MEKKYIPNHFDILVERVATYLERQAVHPNYLRIRSLLREYNLKTIKDFEDKFGGSKFKSFKNLYTGD